MLVASLAGLAIAAAAALAVQPARADEVAAEDLIIVCPSEDLLRQLIFHETTGEEKRCSFALWSEVEFKTPSGSLFGNTYDAWLLHLVEQPAQMLPQVDFYTVKMLGYKAYVATDPLSFLDEHLVDGETFADGDIHFGLQIEQFEIWPKPGLLQPIAVASLE